jgi:FtsP/CotA-like multicopper oxidase with cupredoxin domain
MVCTFRPNGTAARGNQSLPEAPGPRILSSVVRFRLLNGSNASIYQIRFKDQRKFHVIASDGGFLEYPVAMTSLMLSAGERAEILVDFSKETRRDGVNLQVNQMRGLSFDALKIKVKDTDRKTGAFPQRFRPLDRRLKQTLSERANSSWKPE